MYSSVVVGTDGSPTADKAVESAARLARQWGAKLHVVTAYRSSEAALLAASGAPMVDAGLGEEVRRQAAEQVTANAVSSWGEGLETKVHTSSGSAVEAILDVADSEAAELIVVGSKGMRGARRLLGSVPNSIAHGAQCAVLIVKTD